MRALKRCRSIALIVVLPVAFAARGSAQDEPVYKGEERSRALGEQELADKEKAREIRVAQAKVHQRALLARIEAVERALQTDYPAERQRWDAEIEPLLGNDTGRAIAGDRAALKRFAAAYQGPHPSPEEVAVVLESVAILKPALLAAFADPKSAYEPDETLTAEVAKKETFAAQAVSGYREPRETISSIVLSLNLASSTPAQRTLKDMLALEKADGMQLAAVEKEKTRRTQIEARLAELEQKRAKRRELEAKSDHPDYLAAFSPFLELSQNRIRGGSYGRGKHPAAYTDIRDAGGFSSPDRMVELVMRSYGRSKWPQRVIDDPDRMQKRFDAFVEIAPIWVEQCKLLYAPDEGGTSEANRIRFCESVTKRKREERESKEAEEETKLREELAKLN